jgi:hypothetical protein
LYNVAVFTLASNKVLRQQVVIHSGHLKKHMQHRTHDPV